MHRRIHAAVLTTALLVAHGATALPAAAEEHRVEVIAEGLNNPRGLTVDADGTVYVAEAGAGGDEFCTTIPGPEGEVDTCMGASSTVTAIAPDGTASTAVADLPSVMLGEGEFGGAADVAVAGDGSLYVSVGLGGNTDLRDGLAADWEPATLFGTIQHADDGSLTELADLAQWEATNDPNAGQPSTEGPQGSPSNDSNPTGLLMTSGGELLAIDAGGNTALGIDPGTGAVSLRGLFEDRLTDAPPFLDLPPGTQMPMQAVPTGLAEGPDGQIAVGELTGFPFPVGGASVRELNDTTTPGVIAEGFTNIMDVAYLDGELYALEIAHNSLLGGFQGALVRVRADGSRIALLRDELVAPGGVAVGPDGMLYITNNSVGAPGTGSVIRFDPSQAADEATQSACPPLTVPGTDLSDVADSTHEEAITCAVWHGIFGGFADGTFQPTAEMTRGQFATTLAGLIRAAGADLPDGPDGQFSDVDGSTHAQAINDLAAADLISGFADGTFGPQASITRAQAVTLMVAAYAHITEGPVPEGPEVFADVSGTHAADISAAAAMGWVRGTTATTFEPTVNIRRGQTASSLTRMASDLIDAGYLTLPS